jgi:hypothetical protein
MSFSLKKLFRSSRSRLISARKQIHLPDCLTNASSMVVVSGPEELDVWSALLLCNNLQKRFENVSLTVLCRERDVGLFSMLDWRPGIAVYDADRRKETREETREAESLRGSGPDLLFVPYDQIPADLTDTILRIEPSVVISFSGEDAVNLSVRIACTEAGQQDRIHRLCDALGFGSDREWEPSVTAHDSYAASELLAPVSGRALPYIFASPGAADVLRKCHEEIPLKLVQSSGRDSLVEGLGRNVRAALVQEASVVATDEPDLWVEALFLRVPVVGLDSKGTFPAWGEQQPASDRVEFLETWESLITQGWQ